MTENRMQSPVESQSANGQAEDRLDSWKDIAAYLQREVRTVQLWRKTKACRSTAIPT